MSGDTSPSTLSIPDLHQATLDEPTLEQLFHDLREHAEVTDVIPKFAQRGYVQEGPISLEEARKLLLLQSARAVQIRYRYEGADWWDTIMAASPGYRLVRIRHEFGEAVDGDVE
jgi:hypothetical protein